MSRISRLFLHVGFTMFGLGRVYSYCRRAHCMLVLRCLVLVVWTATVGVRMRVCARGTHIYERGGLCVCVAHPHLGSIACTTFSYVGHPVRACLACPATFTPNNLVHTLCILCHTPARVHAGAFICGQSIPNSKIAPLFVKMAQNLDLRCVLVTAPWVLGPKHVSNPE